MPDLSGNIVSGETIAKNIFVASINQKITNEYTAQVTWAGGSKPSPYFPSTILNSTGIFTSINTGDIPTNDSEGRIDNQDIGPILQTFCEQFTVLRNCNYIEYLTRSGYVDNTPLEMLNVSGYTRFLDGSSVPSGSYTLDDNGVPITYQTIDEVPSGYNIETDGFIKAGIPYTVNGFNDFVNAIKTEIQSEAVDQAVRITYTYCHDQCHSQCHSNCSHSYHSDIRLKKNIKIIGEYLPGIALISFNYLKDIDCIKRIGIIAQDVMRIYPELINVDCDGYLTVNYSGLRDKYESCYSTL